MKALTILLLLTLPALAAHQDWVVSHQPDRFRDRVMMEAWADADTGPARMMLYCDSENGFRVMILPHRRLMAEGPARLTVTLDQTKPLPLAGDAFGDDQTDVVTLHDASRVQGVLTAAHRVLVRYEGAGEDAFTLGELGAQRALLLKTCPLPR